MKITKIFLSILMATIILFCLSACGKEANMNASRKGTKDNPYTLDDIITITSYAWEGNIHLGGKVIGKNTFELSNLRIENGELSVYDSKEKDIKVLVFDKKCIETCYENGMGWLETGNIYVENFFNPNMQSIDFTDITESYTEQDNTKVVYFEDTTYTEAYAMCKKEFNEIITNDETYSLVRIHAFNKNLEDEYIYIKLD